MFWKMHETQLYLFDSIRNFAVHPSCNLVLMCTFNSTALWNTTVSCGRSPQCPNLRTPCSRNRMLMSSQIHTPLHNAQKRNNCALPAPCATKTDWNFNKAKDESNYSKPRLQYSSIPIDMLSNGNSNCTLARGTDHNCSPTLSRIYN